MAQDEEAAAEWLLGTEEEVKDYLYSISSERLSRLFLTGDYRAILTNAEKPGLFFTC